MAFGRGFGLSSLPAVGEGEKASFQRETALCCVLRRVRARRGSWELGLGAERPEEEEEEEKPLRLCGGGRKKKKEKKNLLIEPRTSH